MKKTLLIILYYFLLIVGIDFILRGLRWAWDGTPMGYRIISKSSEKEELKK